MKAGYVIVRCVNMTNLVYVQQVIYGLDININVEGVVEEALVIIIKEVGEKHMKFPAYIQDGKLKMSNFFASKFAEDIAKNPNARYEVIRLTPESRNMRRYYFSILKLWCYLDGNDYKNSDLIEKYHEASKLEFNAEMVNIGGKVRKIGKSSKGSLKTLIEALISYLEDNYGIDRAEVCNPDDYKYFMDVVYIDGKYDDFISYLLDIGKLKNTKTKIFPWRQ